MSEINQGTVPQALSALFYDIQSITETLSSLVILGWDYKHMPPHIFFKPEFWRLNTGPQVQNTSTLLTQLLSQPGPTEGHEALSAERTMY